MNNAKSTKLGRRKTDGNKSSSSEQKLLLYFSSIAHSYTHIVILAIIPLLPLIRSAEGGFDLSWRDSFLFAFITIFFFGLGSVPLGYVADRVGPLKVIFAGLCVVILSIILIITAVNLIIFSIGLMLLGLGSSFYHPAGLSLVSQVFIQDRGLPMGIHGFLGNVGELTTPFISGIIGAFYGWRSAYVLWLILGIIILIWNVGLISSRVQDKFVNKITKKKSQISSTKHLFLKAFTITIILAMIYALLFELAYRGTIQLIPFAVKDFYNLSENEASILGGLFVTTLIGTGAFAQLAGGKLADRYGNKIPLFLFSLLAVAALLLMISKAFAFEFEINETRIVIDTIFIGSALFGFGLFGTQPILNKFYAEATPVQIRGLFYGLMFFTKVGLASLALLAIALLPEDNIILGFALMLCFTISAAIIVIFIKERKK